MRLPLVSEPCHAAPTDARPHPAVRRRASPHVATPAEPCSTTPSHAMPMRTLACLPSRAMRDAARLALTSLALPRLPCLATPNRTAPSEALRCLPCLSTPRLGSRQLGTPYPAIPAKTHRASACPAAPEQTLPDPPSLTSPHRATPRQAVPQRSAPRLACHGYAASASAIASLTPASSSYCS